MGWYGWLYQWSDIDVENYYKLAIKRCAFAMRYTHMTLNEYMGLEREFANDLLTAIGEILKEENTVK